MRTCVNITVYLDDIEVGGFMCSDAYSLDGLRTLADQYVGPDLWNRIQLDDLDPRPQGHDNDDRRDAEGA